MKLAKTMTGAAAVSFAVVTSAIAQDAPGVTDDTITVGGIMGLSGVGRLTSEPYEMGARAYLDAVNEAGGVHGRQVEWIIEDDAYQPSRAVAAAKKLVERDKVFMIFGQFGTASGYAVAPYVEQAGVPMMMATAGPTPVTKYTFGGMGTFADSMHLLTSYLFEEQPDSKIAVFYQNDDYGQAGLKGVKATAEEVGGELVAEVGFERNATDYTNQLIKLRDSGADTVIAIVAGNTLAQAIKAADGMDFIPTWASTSIASTKVVMDLLGDRKDGIIYISELDSPNSEEPGVEELRANLEKYYPKFGPDWGSMLGYAHAQILVHALEGAGENPTRDAVVAALEETKDLSVATMGPITFTAEDHNAAHTARLFLWDDNKAVAQSDWLPLNQVAE